MGTPSCRLGPHVPEHSAGHAYHLHTGWILTADILYLSFCTLLVLNTRWFVPTVDWVPILRELVSVGLKIFALCVSCSLSLLTIAAGWLFYRPLVAAALAALALVPVFLARSGLSTKKKEWLFKWISSRTIQSGTYCPDVKTSSPLKTSTIQPKNITWHLAQRRTANPHYVILLQHYIIVIFLGLYLVCKKHKLSLSVLYSRC